MIKTNCNNCGWEGPAENLDVHEETDHEVWNVFTCPKCGEVVGQEPKAVTERDQ